MESELKPWLFADIDDLIDEEPNLERDIERQLEKEKSTLESKQLERHEKECADGTAK